MRYIIISCFAIVSFIECIYGQTHTNDYCESQEYNTAETSISNALLLSKLSLPDDTLNFCLLSKFLVQKKNKQVDNTLIDSIMGIAEERFERALYEKSLVYSDYGIALANNNNDTTRILSLSLNKVWSLYRLGQFYKSHNTILECKELAQKSKNHEVYGSLLIREGYIYWRILHREKALETADKYYSYFKKHSLSQSELYSYHGLLATIYRSQEKFIKSRIHGDSAIYYAYLLDDDKAKGLALSNRSIQYSQYSTEDMEYRIDLMKKALGINQRMNDRQQLGSNYGAISLLYKKNEEFSKAIKYLNMALEISEQINNNGENYNSHKRLSDILDIQEKYRDALYHEKKELTLYKRLYGSENLYKIYKKTIEFKNQSKLEKLQDIEYLKEKNEIQARKEQNQILTILIGSLFILGFLSTTIIRTRMKSKIENAIIKEEISNQLYALETKTLRSQMNPHFLFNSLNSIKSYIAKKEPRQATKYLNKFSHLIRQILDVSKEEWISLEDELKALKLYVELEQLRMSNAFEFSIQISSDVNSQEIKVPPLIFQPFVENSIWHGLSHKKGKKILSIKIHKNLDKTIVTINDNGIGRKASALIKKQSNIQHISHGMRITKERLRLSDKKFRDNFKITTIDLHNPNNKAEGTETIIEIPTILK